MMKICRYKNWLLGLACLVVVVGSQADTPPAPTQSHVTLTASYCPPPSQLVLTGLIWSAPGGWLSYSESFDKKIIAFEKAQWQGVNIGKILCIYKGNNSISFPIVLEQKHVQLVPEPQGTQWESNEGGYKNCVSDRVEDCPFTIKKPAPPVDPYQEIDFFKKRNH